MNFKTVNEIVSCWNEKRVRSKAFATIYHKKYTYQELSDTVYKMATIFQQHDMPPGSRVVLSVTDPLQTSILFWSMLASGITVVGIDPEVGRDRAQFIIHQAEAEGFILDEKLIADWDLIGDQHMTIPVKAAKAKRGKLYKKLLSKKKEPIQADNSYPAMLEVTVPVNELKPVSSDTLAYILFTSGTTSNPKGVMISHRNLFTHIETLGRQYHIDEHSRILNILMLYHVDGIAQGPLLAGYNQCHWYRPLEFEIPLIPDLLDSIYRDRITHAVLVPTIIYLVNKFGNDYEDSFETEDFQCIISVSSHLELALWESFEQKFKARLVNVYGLTETVAGSFFCGPDDAFRKIGTIGKPADCEARILSEEGKILGADQEGELQIKGDHVFVGYFNNDKATEEAFDGAWLNTGDLAICDKEGFYRITGRKKNIVISGGINIHPEEVTEIVNTHPLVRDSASFGEKDEAFGEKLVSCVALETGANLTTTELTAFLRERLEQSKVPSEIHFMAALPKGLSGKVQLNVLREQLSNQQNSSGGTSSDVYTAVIQSAAKAFAISPDQLDHHASSKEIEGWDSMAHLNFILMLENHFKMRFSTADIMVMNSIQTAVDIVKRYQSQL